MFLSISVLSFLLKLTLVCISIFDLCVAFKVWLHINSKVTFSTTWLDGAECNCTYCFTEHFQHVTRALLFGQLQSQGT